MKTLILLAALVLSQNLYAQDLPTCDDPSETAGPCVVAEEIVDALLVDMMLANKKGMKLIHSTGDYGLVVNGFCDGPTNQITVLKSGWVVRMEEYESIKKYEVQLIDCEGTDACGDSYVWTVIETLKSDGYTSTTTYQNTLTKISPRTLEQ